VKFHSYDVQVLAIYQNKVVDSVYLKNIIDNILIYFVHSVDIYERELATPCQITHYGDHKQPYFVFFEKSWYFFLYKVEARPKFIRQWSQWQCHFPERLAGIHSRFWVTCGETSNAWLILFH